MVLRSCMTVSVQILAGPHTRTLATGPFNNPGRIPLLWLPAGNAALTCVLRRSSSKLKADCAAAKTWTMVYPLGAMYCFLCSSLHFPCLYAGLQHHTPLPTVVLLPPASGWAGRRPSDGPPAALLPALPDLELSCPS